MTDQSGGYDPAFYELLYAAEDTHFWFKSRNQVIAALASAAVSGLAPGYRVLEFGCGDGNVIRFLQSSCPDGIVVGMDLFEEGLRYARKRGAANLVQADVLKAPFAKKFHVVGMFDVLEHIPDDSGVLRQVFDLLEPGGTLLLTVPAHPALWSYFDEASHHCRRYTTSELRGKLQAAGFSIGYLSQYMMPLFPLMWLNRRISASRGRDVSQMAQEEFRINPLVNAAMNALIAAERPLLARRWRLPMGTSLVAVARR